VAMSDRPEDASGRQPAPAETTGERQDDNKLIAQRREKLAQLRGQGIAFPNDFRRDALAADLHAAHAERAAEDLE